MSFSLARTKSSAVPIFAKRKGSSAYRKHLTKSEYIKYRNGEKWPLIEVLLSLPVAELSQPSIFPKLLTIQKDYVLLLAFLQRGILPIELAFPQRITLNKFPFSILPNFLYFEELFERHYSSIYQMDSEKWNMKVKKKPLLQTVACLWFAGYALKDGLGGNEIITTSTLNEARKIAKYHKSSLAILAKMLAKEADSYVERKSLVRFNEAEKNLWIAAGIFSTETSFGKSLFNFVFSYLVGRVNGTVADDHFNDEGILLFRFGKRTISQNYWKSIAKYNRYFAIQAKILSVNDLSEDSIIKVYNELISQMKGRVNKISFRMSIRQWLRWLNRTTNTRFNIDRIIPTPKRVLSKNHGRVFSMSKAYIFIQNLLNNQSALFNENDLMDFRYRRGCLLILSTAARPNEIVNLLKEAITKDSQGNYWIRFHKTKTIRNQPIKRSFEWVHQVALKSDAVKWFHELLHFSPSKSLHFPVEWGGDDLTELRLLATRHNDAPIRVGSFNKFLARIQRKLWPELTKPYFTPHNLRALHLTYRQIIGDNDLLLERQAGHTHPSSKKPYTQTMSAEEVGKFADIFKKGVWGKTNYETTNVDEQSSKVYAITNLDEITKISSKFMVTPTKLEEVFKLTQKVMEAAPLKFRGNVLESDAELSESVVGGYTHNCNAHILLNCGHTPGHCRACDYYSPDKDSEDAHRVEVFREMLHYFYCIEAEKELKSTGQRRIVFQKADDIKDRLSTTENKLWVDKFGMKLNEAKKLHAMLWKKAKTYFNQNSKLQPKSIPKPIPNSEEILKFIDSGEMA